MKTLIKFSLLMLVACCFCLSACKKESDPPTNQINNGVQLNNSNNNNNNNNALNAFKNLVNNNQPQKVTNRISADNDRTIIGYNTRVSFYAGAFTDASGNTVTGDVDIEIQEFFTPAQMILGNKTTVSTQGLLESRGEVYINATKNGQQLGLKPGYAQIAFEGTDFTQPMSMFTGTVSGSLNDVNWTLNAVVPATNAFQGCSYDSLNPPIVINPSTASICDTLYTFPLNEFGWINCDYFMRDNYNPLTELTMNVPAGYDNNNTRVYVAFTTINSAVTVYTYANNAFSLSGGWQVPVGMQATIVALAYINGQWQSSFTPITITNNHAVTLTFTPTTIADYTTQVNAL